MISFISVNGPRALVNGKALAAPLTRIDGYDVVQLRKARTEESKFDWNGRNIQEVKMSGVLIYDAVDVACLSWFVEKGIKVDCSEAKISPDALRNLISSFNDLNERNIVAIPGSTISLPLMGGFTGRGLTTSAEALCKEIGFIAEVSM